jgi:hypothetical protein
MHIFKALLYFLWCTGIVNLSDKLSPLYGAPIKSTPRGTSFLNQIVKKYMYMPVTSLAMAQFSEGTEIFLFATTFEPALGSKPPR